MSITIIFVIKPPSSLMVNVEFEGLGYMDNSVPGISISSTEILANQVIAGGVVDGEDYRLSFYAKGKNERE